MAYLFVHFTGEHENGEQIYLTVSRDGLYWKELNHGEPVLFSNVGECGVRDPFPYRDPLSGKFRILATDLCIHNGKGWGAAQFEGSRDLIFWESDDLIRWSEPRAVTLAVENAGCAWAPEAIFDEERGETMIFWASMVKNDGDPGPKQRIFRSYTKDFVRFTPAEQWLERDGHVIDTTVVKDGAWYYRFSMNGRTVVERSKDLSGAFEPVESPFLDALKGVEGPECYRLPDGRWCLIEDRFAAGLGYLPLITSDLASGDFAEADGYDMGRNKKRHGGVLEITDEEYDRLWRALGSRNPVIEGQFADPDLAFFNGKTYLYPTSDGFEGWGGKAFSVFESEDGLSFRRAAKVLDFADGDVPWAVNCAWAPCIAERNGKYFFYFCGKGEDGVSAIGAAEADSPTGPFTAMPEPLITLGEVRSRDVQMGQTIDPSIFRDEESGAIWLLFGNGAAAAVKLSEDMRSVDWNTLTALRGLTDFREAVTVFFRDGLYHFTWSCDDTGSENYHVNYGTAQSLTGEITFRGTILEKDPARGILGTGHHAIAKKPDGSYVIAYHRFHTPLGKFPGYKGFHRETCLAPLTFGPDGLIEPVRMPD